MDSDFPEELLSGILLRLPVKSLLRFECVEKSWYSHITSPDFAKLHFDCNAPHDHQLLLDALPTESRIQSLDLELEGSLEEHYVDLVFPIMWSPFIHDEFYVEIIGASRGFILFAKFIPPKTRHWTPSAFLVSNPATGVHKTIPFSPSFFPTVSKIFGSDRYNDRILYAFEYDALRDDYYVVITLSQVYRTNINQFFLVNSVMFFSMRTNSWTQLNIPGLPYHERRCESPYFSFVNGAMHWLTIAEYLGSVNGIIAFDFIDRNVSKIPLPRKGLSPDNYDEEFRLEVIRGCLCLLYYCWPSKPWFAELWMMKECDGKSSWTKFNYMPTYAVPTCSFTPIYFTKGGEIVGLDGKYSVIVKLNDKGELLCYHGSRPFERQQDTYMYTRSLLSLPSNSVQP